MREIKFRAWDTLNKRFLNGTYGLMDTFVNSYSKGRLIFMQYIGLKDKNGKEIYEGDIIDNGRYIAKVVWEDYRRGFGLQDKKNTTWNNPDFFRCKVIGNIYENSELLK